MSLLHLKLNDLDTWVKAKKSCISLSWDVNLPSESSQISLSSSHTILPWTYHGQWCYLNKRHRSSFCLSLCQPFSGMLLVHYIHWMAFYYIHVTHSEYECTCFNEFPWIRKRYVFLLQVDSVIQDTKNLMNSVAKTVTTCFICATKVSQI